MSTRVLAVLCIAALIVFALRFMPTPPLSTGITDFAGGFAFGCAVGLAVIWLGRRE